MKCSELISVVVPVYKVEKYLRKCVDSLLNQTYKNLEIILVDDGSPDNCPAICDEYADKDNRIKVFHKENGGLSDARNFGISKTTGKYIGFVDSDDFIEENMYQELYDSIKQNDADISICSRNIAYENGDAIPYCKNDGKIFIMNPEEAITKIFGFADYDMAAWDKLYKRQLFDDVQYPKGKINEDYYVTPVLFRKSNKIVYLRKCLYNYLRRSNSITNNNSIKMDCIEASEFMVEYFKKNFRSNVYVAQTAEMFAYICVLNKFIIHKKNIDDKLWEKSKFVKKKNFKSVMKNKNVSLKKKFQVFLFVYFFWLYKFIIGIAR